MIGCCIFDLDGVVVDTARYHYQAWADLAHTLGFDFTPEMGEATRGVSRMASLDIVLAAGGMATRFSAAEKEQLADWKNTRYLTYIARMSPNEVLPGVRPFLEQLRHLGIRTVLGSGSKNAGTILDRCHLRVLFDHVVDGTCVSRAKPDPEVFLSGAQAAAVQPAICLVFEDAAAGIEAATRAGMRSVGVGKSPTLNQATIRIDGFDGLTPEQLAVSLNDTLICIRPHNLQ